MNNKRRRLAHLTSVHPRVDVRVFAKECCSLVRAGYDVTLVVADGEGHEIAHGVRIHDLGKARLGRLGRMSITLARMHAFARGLGADVYHIHDPELLPVGIMLRNLGYKVIYDAHEDVPRQIMSKHWIYQSMRGPISRVTEWIEDACARRMSAVIGATPTIERRFASLVGRTETIRNFPIMKEFLIDSPWEARGDEACYVGGIALSRGLAQMVEACGLARVPLNLAGPRDPGAMEVLERLPAWRGVRDLGILNRRGVSDLLARVRIGLVTLSPEPNIVESLPVKLFEYMAAGVPVVASNFPLWKEIVEGNECGFCVDPRDTAAVAGAIRKIIGSPGEARRMGQNGQRAVKDVYSWSREEIKLLALYQSIVGAC